MATVYRTTVMFTSNDFWRTSGETVDVNGETYVRSPYGSLLERLDTNWQPTQAAADECAAIELERRIEQIRMKLTELRRPLPAVAAADSSAAGRAHAAVAK